MQFWLNLGFIREVEQLPALAVAAEAAGFESAGRPGALGGARRIDRAL